VEKLDYLLWGSFACADPRRLFGGHEAFEHNMRDLPGYADLDDISSRPMHEVVLRSG
jgi:hypothetical protein